MKNIDNAKLYHALKNANIQGAFTAYTPFDGSLKDVENFSRLPYDAIISYKWYLDEKNFVSVDSWYDDHIDVLIKINDYYLPYEYRDKQIRIMKNFGCPNDIRNVVCEILSALTAAFNSAAVEKDD